MKRIQSVPLVIGQFLEAVDQNYAIVGELHVYTDSGLFAVHSACARRVADQSRGPGYGSLLDAKCICISTIL